MSANTAAARLLIMQAGHTPAAAFLLIRILDLQGLSDGACTKSAKGLAKDCGLHPRSVEKSLRQLEKDGWLHVERRPGKRARRRVLMPATETTTGHAAGSHDGDRPTDRPQVPASRPVHHRPTGRVPEEGPAPEPEHPRPPGRNTPGPQAGSNREHLLEHLSETPPQSPPEVRAVERGRSSASPEERLREHDRLASASRVAMARAVESKGGTYMGQDRPDHLEVGQAAAAWAERRGRELGDVLREWATEWVGVANTRSARSWRSWASAKASGTPWSSKGRASGMVRLHADLSTIKDFGDADIPVDEGKRVIGYG